MLALHQPTGTSIDAEIGAMAKSPGTSPHEHAAHMLARSGCRERRRLCAKCKKRTIRRMAIPLGLDPRPIHGTSVARRSRAQSGSIGEDQTNCCQHRAGDGLDPLERRFQVTLVWRDQSPNSSRRRGHSSVGKLLRSNCVGHAALWLPKRPSSVAAALPVALYGTPISRGPPYRQLILAAASRGRPWP